MMRLCKNWIESLSTQILFLPLDYHHLALDGSVNRCFQGFFPSSVQLITCVLLLTWERQLGSENFLLNLQRYWLLTSGLSKSTSASLTVIIHQNPHFAAVGLLLVTSTSEVLVFHLLALTLPLVSGKNTTLPSLMLLWFELQH